MRATGSNTASTTEKILSIRLRQNGQYFSLTTLTDCDAPEKVSVEVDCPLCAAHPTNTRLTSTEIVEAEGIACPEHSYMLQVFSPDELLCVTTVLSAEAMDAIYERCAPCSENVEFRPFLMSTIERAMQKGRRNRRLALTVTDCSLYAALTDRGQLLFCDAFEYHNAEEMLYIIGTIDSDFPLRRADVVLSGESAAMCVDSLKNRFRHIKCE